MNTKEYRSTPRVAAYRNLENYPIPFTRPSAILSHVTAHSKETPVPDFTTSIFFFCASEEARVSHLLSNFNGRRLAIYKEQNAAKKLHKTFLLATGTYFVSQTIERCESKRVELYVEIRPQIMPDFPTTLTLLKDEVAPLLENKSPNGVKGIWRPKKVSNTASGIYVFTPNLGESALPLTLAVTVYSMITPSFKKEIEISAHVTPPVLETIAPNGVKGTWLPKEIDNTASGSYTFTPNAGQYAEEITLTVTVIK